MSNLDRLRCWLRSVNIEYSALVGCKTEEALARMTDLSAQRKMLMMLIARERQADSLRPPREVRRLTEPDALRGRERLTAVAPQYAGTRFEVRAQKNVGA
jgi:hypothetical protein